MTLDATLRAEMEASLGARIANARPVGGGCISPAWRVHLVDGATLFVKTAPAAAPDDMLLQEAYSLRRIAATGAVQVPQVAAVTEQWLALEWLEPAVPSERSWAELGRSVARLHRQRCDRYGWDQANCIGSLPQSNGWTTSWPQFWREHRLLPQLERAAPALGAPAMRHFRDLLDSLENRLSAAGEDGASLLHGDLWSGNVHFTGGGAALIDPSSSCGHREVDLAMAALFGGFPPVFFSSYEDEWPLLADADRRRPIYQLYYVLVHVNLFGDAYVRQARRLLDHALR